MDQRLNQFLSMSSPVMSAANMDGNATSELTQSAFSAMIAAIANSPPGLNSPGSVPPPMSSTPIPSPQSAFALLRNSAIVENQKNQSGNFQTVLSPIVSSAPNLTAQNLGMYMEGLSTSSAFHATNAPQMLSSTFGTSIAPSLNSHLSPAVNALAPNSPLQRLAQVADAAPLSPAQMLLKFYEASKNIDPNLLMALAAKNLDQNHLLMALAAKLPMSTLVNSLPATQSATIVPELPISTANLNANQFSFSPQCLSQTFAASSTYQNKTSSGNANYNIASPSNSQGSPGKSQSTTCSSATSTGNPPRKIRRRRPKSPAGKSVLVKSPQSNAHGYPSPGGVGASPEHPHLITSDEPCDPMVNNSPPSLIPHQDVSFGQVSAPKRCLSEDGVADDHHSSKEICEGSPMDSKKCLVCGDRATGYNFNVITCESCKAFFRRNALRPKDFKCPYEGNCEINTVSRRFCQKCRLKKCADVGMKKEWILNDEQLKRRKNSRLKSCNQTSPQNISSQFSPGSVASPISSPRSVCRTSSVLSQIESPRPTSVSSVLKMDVSEINERKLHEHRHSPMKAHSSGMSQMNDVKTNHILTSMRPSLDMPMRNEAGSSAFHHVSQNQILIPKSENLGLSSVFGNSQFPGAHALLMPDSKAQLTAENLQHLLRIQAQSSAIPHLFLKQEPSTPCSVPSSESIGTPTANLANQLPSQISTEPPNYNIPSIPEMATSDNYAALSKLGSPKAAVGQEMTPEQNIEHYKKMNETMERTIRDALDNDIMDHVDYHPLLIQDCVFNDTKQSYQLNHDEKMQIDFVLDAFKCFDEPMDHQRAKKLETEINLDDPTKVMNLMDVVMRRVVKMSKKMPSFNDLSTDGKFKLLKSAMIAMTTLRGLVTLDMATQSFKSEVIGKANVSCNMFDKLNNPEKDHPQKECFMGLAKVLHKQIREDKTAMSLLALVVLFHHSQKLTVESDKVKGRRHYDAYLQLLRRHLESQHGNEAAAIVATIPTTITTLQKVCESAVGLFMGKVKRSEIEALPTEFFRTTSAVQSSQDNKADTSLTE
ncbi:zinc finger, c4 type (two domains) domain-containing protein [Ditylenchus destructor]|uniref:Zinc finger, c4 type (Two domains) domain-containing protein n=1 Tax=Ditylenchus destructor TaxID=166010 RepID=A0AAD4R873_9BILA|nr:zinc finger, c4 type (two domains) domain-containing protein [Ditylenchus destructor]